MNKLKLAQRIDAVLEESYQQGYADGLKAKSLELAPKIEELTNELIEMKYERDSLRSLINAAGKNKVSNQ